MTYVVNVLQYLGVWRPECWPSGLKTYLYYFYTSFVMSLTGFVIISELFELIETIDGVESMANKSFMLLTLMSNFAKAVNILIKRGEIIALMNVLQEDPCKPKNKQELEIQSKADSWIDSILMGYWTLGGMVIVANTWTSLLKEVPKRLLPYACLIDFDYSESLLMYTIVYVFQLIGEIVSVGFGATFDILVVGLMLQTCCQLHILKKRIDEMPKIQNDNKHNASDKNEMTLFEPESKLHVLSRCVDQHIEIFKFAETANDLFSIMIFVQYSISTLVMCVSVFSLSQTTLFSSEFLMLITYTGAMLIQIFIYCYYGFKVTNESISVANAVYATNWDTLSVNMQRSLVMIMVRSLRPIEFISGYVITLNFDYFKSLLKVSYSAYNVLQKSSR